MSELKVDDLISIFLNFYQDSPYLAMITKITKITDTKGRQRTILELSDKGEIMSPFSGLEDLQSFRDTEKNYILRHDKKEALIYKIQWNI